MENRTSTWPAAEPAGAQRDKLSGLRPLLRLLHYLGPHRRYALLTVLFGSAGFLLSFVYPYIIGSVVDLVTSANVPPARREQRLWSLAQLGASVAVAHALIVYGRGHYNVLLGDAIVIDLRRELFEHLQKLSVRFYAKQQGGTILSRVLHDVKDATSIIYMGIVVAAMDAAQLLLAFVLLVQISPKLTAACVAVFPLYGLVFALTNPRMREASERVRAKLSQISGDISERIAGQALIKTYTAEQREAKRFSAEVEHHHRLIEMESHQGHLVAGSSELLVELGTTIVVGYGGWLALRGELTAGMLTRFLGYVVILYGPVRRFAELNITYQSSLAAIRRIFRLLEIEPTIVDAPFPRLMPPSAGHLRFEGVRFAYEDGSDEARSLLDDERAPKTQVAPRWVLDELDLEALPGQRIAIVGPSGAGKTTLVSLVPRLYDPAFGRVLIDAVDVRSYSLQALRSAIAIVQQDSFVFTGTIRENIAYGRPDAPEADVVEAAKAAHAHDFISALPGGYDALLGERGVNLSGGQRQRISIARALLKDPKILILDEATSSLDAESELLVQQALDQLMKGRTCLIIAHRLSTIRNADRIVVLEGGRIVESGKHDQLVASQGRYARFIRSQTVVL